MSSPRCRRASSRARWVGLVLFAVASASGCGNGDDQAFELGSAAAREADYRYVIPAGSGEAIDRGEPVEILPGSLEVVVGEVIEIVNEDDRGHLVGPFFVGAHEMVRHAFASTGTFEGICSVHPSGQIVITVS